jgi:hypothetical protein
MLRLETIVILLAAPWCNYAFTPMPNGVAKRADIWKLGGGVIRGEGENKEEFDRGQGGVRLAQESVIKITGTVKHTPGSADAEPMDLMRYNNLKKVEESHVNDVLKKIGASIICKGAGKELYKDPGQDTIKEVRLSPSEAIKDALKEAGSAMQAQKLVFNFLGGDDLMMKEICDATNDLVLQLDVATKAKIAFNSICHMSVPSGSCSVTVVAMGEENGDELEGADKSVANGEVYYRDGNWFTVEESEMITSLSS